MSPSTPRFDRCNLSRLPFVPECAHGGEGEIQFARIAEGGALSGACNFIDVAVLPPGVSIGRHRHAPDEEEFYLVLEGEGLMSRGEEQFRVESGDLIRNPPGGTHELRNDGSAPLRIFVFEVGVPG